MTSGIPGSDLILMGTIIFAGALLQSFTGFGFALIVAPIAALLMPELLPAPIIALTLVVTLFYMRRAPEMVDWKDFGFIMAGRIPLSLIAGFFLTSLNPDWMSLTLGVLLMMAVAITWRRFSIPPAPMVLFVAGGLSGFFGTLTSVGAPPLAVAYQNRSGPTVRATLGANIIFGSAISLIVLMFAEQINWPQLGLQIAISLPFLMAGSCIGGYLAHSVSGEMVRKVTLVICASAAVALIVKSAVSMVRV